MAIRITCPSCQRKGELPEGFTGKKIKCPACGAITEVAAARTSPPPPPASKKPEARPAWADELDDVDEAPAPPPSRSTRGAAPSRSVEADKPRSKLPILLGVGGGLAIVVTVSVSMYVRNNPPAVEANAVGVNWSIPAQQAPPDNGNDFALVAANNAPSGFPPPSAPPANYAPTGPGGLLGAGPPNDSPAEAIKRVKDATVYVKVKDGAMQGTGTGFVIDAQGDRVTIATNRHVVHHTKGDDDEETPEDKPDAPRPPAVVTVVFRSGDGPGNEVELPAEVLAKDSSGDPSRDLAILRVKGVARPPRPITVNRSTVPTEGMDLKIYGFPFGQSLNFAGSGSPAITINKASISSLRRDNLGHLALIQVDGSVHPGNSGGPIVDVRGQLVGVTVAKLKIADNFGLAIPAVHLDELLAGRVGHVEIERMGDKAGSVEFTGTANVDDPNDRLREVSMLIAPSTGPPPKPAEGGLVGQVIPNARPFALAIDRAKKMAVGKFTLPIGGPLAQVLVQVVYTAGDGKRYFFMPRVYSVPAGGGKLVAVGEESDELATRAKKTKAKLGPLQDLDKDCALDKEGKGLKITVPGKLHTLSPQLTDKKGKAIKNAPMTLAAVSGDFVLHVKVTGEMRPGIDQLANPKSGKSLGLTYMGAGIVLWQDANNYVRLERSVGTAGGPILVTRLLVEVCKDGHEAGRPYYIDVPEGPMSVMLVRYKGHIRCLFSNDGKKWTVLQELAAEFPEKLQVGLLAVNISKKPLTAEFQDIALIEDSDKVAEFGK